MKSVVEAREALLQAQHDYQEQHARPGFRDKEVVLRAVFDNKPRQGQYTPAKDAVSSDCYQPPEVLMHNEEVALRAKKGNHLAVLDDCPDDLLPPSAFAGTAASNNYEAYKKEVARQAAQGNHLAAVDDCPDDLLPPSAVARKQYYAKREAEEAVQTRSTAQKAPNEGTKRAPETPEQKGAAEPPKKVKKSPGRPPKTAKKLAQDE